MLAVVLLLISILWFMPCLSDTYRSEYSLLEDTTEDVVFSETNIWLQYAHNKAAHNHQYPISNHHPIRVRGYSIGIDSTLEENKNITTGIFYTHALGNISEKCDNSGHLDSKDHIFGISSSWLDNDFFFQGQIQYARGGNSGYHDNNHLSYDNRYQGFTLTAGYTYDLVSNWQWQPWLSFNRYTIKTNNIHGSATSQQSTILWNHPINAKYRMKEAGGGLKLMGRFQAQNSFLSVMTEFGIQGFHNFKDDPVNIAASFGKAGYCFLVDEAEKDHYRYQYDVALNMEYAGQTFLTINYSHQWSDNFKVDGVLAIMRYEF